jgi:hypothetical protein
MKGYVMNKSGLWAHAMKRSIGPGQKVELDEIYDQYGKKHGLEKGEQFVEWLRTIKLRDPQKWAVVVEKPRGLEEDSTAEEKIIQKEIKTITTADQVSPKKMTVQDVTALSVRKAREVLQEISDVKLLKYSLKQANTLAGKDTLCRLLRKRISELEVAGFH